MWYFALFTLGGDFVLAGCAGGECSNTDSSSLASSFFRENKRIIGFLNPMRVRSLQGPAGGGGSDRWKWGLELGSSEGGGG